MSRSPSNRAAIAGIGQTEFSKESGRSELQLACEATKAALDDAGLQPRDVEPDDVTIGMPVQAFVEHFDNGVSLPQFRPRRTP